MSSPVTPNQANLYRRQGSSLLAHPEIAPVDIEMEQLGYIPVDDFIRGDSNPPQLNHYIDQPCQSEHSSNKEQPNIFNPNPDMFQFTHGGGLGNSNGLVFNQMPFMTFGQMYPPIALMQPMQNPSMMMYDSFNKPADLLLEKSWQ